MTEMTDTTKVTEIKTESAAVTSSEVDLKKTMVTAVKNIIVKIINAAVAKIGESSATSEKSTDKIKTTDNTQRPQKQHKRR